MRVLFLGTSSGKPSKYRNVTSIAIIMEDANYCLIDCGEATQHQLMKTELKLSRLNSIFITHLHGDHIFGLHGLLCTLNEIRKEPLTIYGPTGISDYVHFVRRNITNYKLLVNEYGDKSVPGIVSIIHQKNYSYSFEACEVEHCNDSFIRCFAYKIVRKRTNPKICISKITDIINKHRTQLEDSGYVPAEKIISLLKKNTTIESPIKMNLSDFSVDEPDFTLIVALDNYNSHKMISVFNSCDVLIHESTYVCKNVNDYDVQDITNMAIKHGHSTNLMAIKTAEKLNANHLILTHFSNRYEQTEDMNKEIVGGCYSVNDKITVDCASDFASYSFSV